MKETKERNPPREKGIESLKATVAFYHDSIHKKGIQIYAGKVEEEAKAIQEVNAENLNSRRISFSISVRYHLISPFNTTSKMFYNTETGVSTFTKHPDLELKDLLETELLPRAGQIDEHKKEIKKWMKKRKTQCQNGPAKPSANGDNWMRCNICLLVAQEEYSSSTRHIKNHHMALHEKVISFEVLKKTPQLEKKKHRSTAKSHWAWYPVILISHRAIDVELAGQYSIQHRGMIRAIKKS